jgi:hypothetical protein
MAGLGTTGVLIGSFFLLLTVGSTLVAFRGVPGAASNGDLSRIELRQQREAAAQRAGGLLAASNFVVETTEGPRHASASSDVFGRLAAGSSGNPTGNIRQGASSNRGSDSVRPGAPGAPVGEKAPSTGSPTPAPGAGTGVIEVPVQQGALADDGSQPTADTGSGSTSGTDTTTGSDSTGGSGTGSGSTDTGTGSSGSDTGSTGGTAGGTVGGTVGDATGAAGAVVGTVSPSTGQTVTDTGSAVGGLLGDATTAVEGLTVGVGS